MRDALRLALGTLTVLPVRAPGVVDRRTAGWAMALAPAVGVLLGLAALGAVLVLRTVFGPWLVAVSVVVLLAGLTRLIHWDGLADTCDGLGSGKPAADALEVMRRSDVGPFGVFAIVAVVAVQVAALAELVAAGSVAAVVPAVVLGRAALPVACRTGVPAARPDGLGSAVAGSVGVLQGVVAAGAVVVVAAGVAAVAGSLDQPQLVVAVVLALAWAVAGTSYLRGRLDGMTGDTLGALVETTTAVALVVLAASP